MSAEEGPRPLCAKCGRPVKAGSKWRDENLRASVYKGFCHGTVDRIVITDEQIANDPTLIGRAIVFFEEPAPT